MRWPRESTRAKKNIVRESRGSGVKYEWQVSHDRGGPDHNARYTMRFSTTAFLLPLTVPSTEIRRPTANVPGKLRSSIRQMFNNEVAKYLLGIPQPGKKTFAPIGRKG